MKITIENGILRHATNVDVENQKLQVVEGDCSDTLIVIYIMAWTEEPDSLTVAMGEAEASWKFFQMGIDRHTDSSVEAINCFVQGHNIPGKGGPNGEI